MLTGTQILKKIKAKLDRMMTLRLEENKYLTAEDSEVLQKLLSDLEQLLYLCPVLGQTDQAIMTGMLQEIVKVKTADRVVHWRYKGGKSNFEKIGSGEFHDKWMKETTGEIEVGLANIITNCKKKRFDVIQPIHSSKI